LGLHEKMLLLAVARHFKENKEAFATLTEVEEAYGVICEEFEEKPYSHTQLWKYLQKFTSLGFVKTQVGAASQRGRSTMVSLPSVPAAELEQELSTLLAMER
jgi:cell division control protein 6